MAGDSDDDDVHYMDSPVLSWNALTNLSPLDRKVHVHLKRVYAMLSLCGICCAASAWYSTTHGIREFYSDSMIVVIPTILEIFLFVFLYRTYSPEGTFSPIRSACLLAIACLQGVELESLLGLAIEVEPKIIVTALMSMAAIFVSFSLAALLSKKRTFLFLGGILFSAVCVLLVVGLTNLFFTSRAVFSLQMYAGLIVFSFFVLYDTQMIVLRRVHGDGDYIVHCLELYLDALNIFQHVLAILIDQQRRRNRRQ